MPAPECLAQKSVNLSMVKHRASSRINPSTDNRSIRILRNAIFASVLFASFMSSSAYAAPTVVVNNNAQQAPTTAPEDPQVAPQPATPFNMINPQSPNQQQTNNGQNVSALQNPNSLASTLQPKESELSAANQQLLSRNAQLQRAVNDLETRVNVLINERSGQLFMYGAVTVAVSLFLGMLLGAFIFGRRDRW
ncbi:hypothetical protein [Psychrobacter sp.]|uniref:hypothetical protein n=1 Tax=Psychrobacter sp. TaxID=56811 RepID=UPI0025DBC549|nr:hypothetical protein [Psychrobacter sp.]